VEKQRAGFDGDYSSSIRRIALNQKWGLSGSEKESEEKNMLETVNTSYPESLAYCSPKTGLLPFQQAAANEYDLDTIFDLLVRRSVLFPQKRL
jgi:hypothetical protein